MLIPLTRGLFTMVDAADFEWLNQWKWSAKDAGGNTFYAARGQRIGRRVQHILMHRLIIGAEAGQIIDHVSRDGLDNRRANLRAATASQNSANCPHYGRFYRGVDKGHGKGRWRARIIANGQNIHLGVFSCSEEAARAYDAAAVKAFGEFAVLNFPSEEHANAPL